jgi:hypothetical protein
MRSLAMLLKSLRILESFVATIRCAMIRALVQSVLNFSVIFSNSAFKSDWASGSVTVTLGALTRSE